MHEIVGGIGGKTRVLVASLRDVVNMQVLAQKGPGWGMGAGVPGGLRSEMMGLLPIQLKMGEMINMTLVITGDLELAWEILYVDRRGQKPFMKHFAKLRRISHGCCSGSKQ